MDIITFLKMSKNKLLHYYKKGELNAAAYFYEFLIYFSAISEAIEPSFTAVVS